MQMVSVVDVILRLSSSLRHGTAALSIVFCFALEQSFPKLLMTLQFEVPHDNSPLCSFLTRNVIEIEHISVLASLT